MADRMIHRTCLRARLPLLGMVVVQVAGCARHYPRGSAVEPYGLIEGLWHGVIVMWSLTANVISWLCALAGINVFRSVAIIGEPNTGLGYYCGFLLGMGLWGLARARK